MNKNKNKKGKKSEVPTKIISYILHYICISMKLNSMMMDDMQKYLSWREEEDQTLEAKYQLKKCLDAVRV